MYINRIELQNNLHVQEKLNYFCDEVELLTVSIGLPCSQINSNTRLIISGLRKLAECNINATHRREYIRNYYEWNKSLLKSDGVVLQKFKNILDPLLKNFEMFKNDTTLPISFILEELKKAETELNRDLFPNAISELKRVLLCPELLKEHNHRKDIDEIVKIYVTEFLFLGLSPLEVRKIFQHAIDQYREKIKDSGKQYINDIPVPPVIHELRLTSSYRKYKAEINKYLKVWGVDKQVENVLYIWQQAVRPKTFVFRISNYHFDEGLSFTYGNCHFANSVIARHDRYFNRGAKQFLKPGIDYIFCEVTVESGSDEAAFHRAVADTKSALNHLNYHMQDKIKGNLKPYVEVFQYLLLKDHSTFTTQHYKIRIMSFDMPYINDLNELSELADQPTVSTFLTLDKIVMEGFGADTKELANSQFWRYCESLFVGEKEAKDVREKLVNYYTTKSEHQVLISLQLMIEYFNNSILNGHRTEELGYTHHQFHELLRVSFTSMEDHIKLFVPIIKHPIINKCFERISNLGAPKIKTVISKQYEIVLKSSYIQRNLYQHSNIVIPELHGIWYKNMEQFCESIRNHIRADLKLNPTVESIELLF